MRLGDAQLRRTVAQLIQLVIAIVERDFRSRTRCRHPKPPGDQVGDALGHQPVGRDFAADDAGESGDAVALFMIDHREVAAHLAAFGLGAKVIERPYARIGPHRPGGAHAIRHKRPFLDHVAYLVPFDRQHFGVRDPGRRRPQDRDTQCRDDDVAVPRLVAAIDCGMRHPMRENDHDALDRDDLDLDLEQPGDEACPGAGCVDHGFAADAGLFSRHRVARQHAGQPVAIASEAGDLRIGARLRSPATRGFDIAHHQIEGVQVAVFRNPEDGTDVFRQGRLAPAGLLDRDPLTRNPRFAAALDETRFPGQILL